MISYDVSCQVGRKSTRMALDRGIEGGVKEEASYDDLPDLVNVMDDEEQWFCTCVCQIIVEPMGTKL
jgi:hypothetical protein